MSLPSHLQIAIDGPAASGKTTVAHLLAQRLKILYLDTGAMYRTLAHLALQSGTDADNEGALARLWEHAQVSIALDESAPLGFRIVADGRELDEATLQSKHVTAIVSTIARRSSRASCERIDAMPARYIFLLSFWLKFSSGEFGKILPPPRQSGLEAIPARARPVPFCRQGLRVDFAISLRSFCLRVPARAFA